MKIFLIPCQWPWRLFNKSLNLLAVTSAIDPLEEYLIIHKKTALSLFIFSPLNSCVINFIKKINNIKRKCTYECVGDYDQIVRMDYAFKLESDLKNFEKNVTELPRSRELIMTMKTAPQELLLHHYRKCWFYFLCKINKVDFCKLTFVCFISKSFPLHKKISKMIFLNVVRALRSMRDW